MSNEDIHAKLAKHAKKDQAEKPNSTEAQEPKAETPKLDHATYESLMSQLNAAEQKSTEYEDRIMRMQADRKNADSRAERDIANAHKYALDKFVNELLPVIDNLERAVNHAEESKDDTTAILEGVKLTLKMLYNVLEKQGVQQVNPMNEAFNPSFHEAVSMQEQAAVKPGIVVGVLQKGYLLNERLVRPALVIVSK